jgi:anti-sigma regulatory factor (Ser/Thr protein kinase)
MEAELPPDVAPVHPNSPYLWLALRAEPRGLHAVRRMVRDRLRAWDRAELAVPAAMCVTELLSNVHSHVASPDCVLTLRLLADGIRISVVDGEPRLPVARRPDHLAESGRGLFLLAGTVDEWGAAPLGTGKEVWFVLRRAERST